MPEAIPSSAFMMLCCRMGVTDRGLLCHLRGQLHMPEAILPSIRPVAHARGHSLICFCDELLQDGHGKDPAGHLPDRHSQDR